MRKKTTIKLGILGVMILGIVYLFYVGFNGTPWGHTTHERQVVTMLTEQHGDVFTVTETTYNFRECPRYITNFYYNSYPNVPLGLQYKGGGEWLFHVYDINGKPVVVEFEDDTPVIHLDGFIASGYNRIVNYLDIIQDKINIEN